MDRTKLKNYAPQARRDFIQAVTDRAEHYGLSVAKVETVTEKGDVVLIGGKAFPRAVAEKRKGLERRVNHHGFDQAMEAMAYTWFNRFVAIRFMEIHGYLEHGYRVLSHPEGKTTPEILEHAEHVDLLGLDKQKVIDLKLDGAKESELYRIILIAQCNALHSAMPFLFERIDDETELLLPDNLLHSDSLIRKLVTEIDEEDWQEVEIIGWLYQFYISEKKDEVIGKVVKSEDIPAATQLFTPNWIVKYLVQNTLGRQWLATYPQSPLHHQMPYYIVPAEQAAGVQEQLKAIIPTSLHPEELTLLDPACGSGHILVEGYDLLKAIYQERGYRAKDIPRLILEKNLFGLEIDDRAAQLAAFALMMKARADDRRIFDGEAKPNILAFQDSYGMNAADITHAINSPILKDKMPPSEYLMEELEDAESPLFSKRALAEKGHVSQSDITTLLELFENAKTFGSLIQVPPKLVARLPDIEQRLADVLKHGDLTHSSAHVIKPLLQQAHFLAMQYDAVVANPPYMGSSYYPPTLKSFVNKEYKEAKADLYSCFIQRNITATRPNGFVGMITIPNWMFLSGFTNLRKWLLQNTSIDTFVHNGRGVFGSDFGSCAFAIRNHSLAVHHGSYRRLFDKQGSVASNEELEQRFFTAKTYTPTNEEFVTVPGSPLAYWISNTLRSAFSLFPPIGDRAIKGISTGNNSRYIREWFEVNQAELSLFSGSKWFPVTKGGGYRRWYGNNCAVIIYENDGTLLRSDFKKGRNPGFRSVGCSHHFEEGVTWGYVSIGAFSARYVPKGFIQTDAGPMIVGGDPIAALASLNSKCITSLTEVVSPSVNYSVGTIALLPSPPHIVHRELIQELIGIARLDWDSFEISWDFQTLPVIRHRTGNLQQSQEAVDAECLTHFARMKELETENNRLFIEAYGLQDELTPVVPDAQITLYRPDREEDIKRLLTYAIGCMMGRYSLDKPGLIYAHSGNDGFDSTQYKNFPADQDGIIPLTDTAWFDDDATNRVIEFIGVVWPKERLEENLKFIADSLGPASNEQSRETIRRYLATGFYKHHLSMYKKRPIYWLFSSGKQRAFQCLVYLHRYNDSTLSRMRTEYVIPLIGKLKARIAQLKEDILGASSTSHRRKLQKEHDDLRKKLAELAPIEGQSDAGNDERGRKGGTFDETLRHYADMRISLDLDDGVKVNYGKFGDLLAEVKAVTGGSEE